MPARFNSYPAFISLLPCKHLATTFILYFKFGSTVPEVLWLHAQIFGIAVRWHFADCQLPAVGFPRKIVLAPLICDLGITITFVCNLSISLIMLICHWHWALSENMSLSLSDIPLNRIWQIQCHYFSVHLSQSRMTRCIKTHLIHLIVFENVLFSSRLPPPHPPLAFSDNILLSLSWPISEPCLTTTLIVVWQSITDPSLTICQWFLSENLSARLLQ